MSKLELYNIYAGYEESKPVLKDISFFVEKGEFIVLLGTSGCGKTTILVERGTKNGASFNQSMVLNILIIPYCKEKTESQSAQK